MRLTGMTAATALTLGCAAPGLAAPTLDIRGAAMRIVVIPEARTNIVVIVARPSRRLPLKVHTFGRNTFVTGDVGHRSRGCQTGAQRVVGIRGRGNFGYDDLPQLIARTPIKVQINAGEAVFGDIGRSASVDLTNRGCGDWTIANIAGRARINQAGSGHIRTGAAGEGDLSVAGSGDINVQAVDGGVTAVSSGAGNVTVASLRGPFNVRIAGSGDIRARSGSASDMNASIAGSGSVGFGGVARTLKASVAGSGDVTVARVAGPVTKHVFGSGDVNIGR